MKGPEFLKYINPVLTTLQANGGAGNSSNIIEQIIENLGITDEELEEPTSNGQSRIRNQIQWARFYLFKAGLIDNAQRGVWRLTNEGLEKKLKLLQGLLSPFISLNLNPCKVINSLADLLFLLKK